MSINRNNRLRLEFQQYLESNFNPSVYLITRHIQISNSLINEWLKGKRDISDSSLDKIEGFLNSRLVK